jgi:hypothetical protein
MIKELKIDGKASFDWVFKDDPYTSYALFSSTCQNPFCKCMELDLRFKSDLSADMIDAQIVVDVKEHRLLEKKIEAGPYRVFADKFMREVSPEDWVSLFRIFLGLKKEAMDEYTDDSPDLPEFDAEEIEKSSPFIYYCDIIPWGEQIRFAFDTIDYVIDDAYCVKSNCPCRHAMITFLPFKNDRMLTKTKLAAALFDYQKKTWREENKGTALGHECDDLASTLLKSKPEIWKIFQKRHIQMKKLYARYKKKHGIIDAPRPPAPITAPRTGRNAPCPCGSGKKYKKCCGKDALNV